MNGAFLIRVAAAFLAALALAFCVGARSEEPPCKNHYILRCQADGPNLEWVTLADSHFANQRGHTATVLEDGRVLVVGFDGAELFEPATGTWRVTGPMVERRLWHNAVRLRSGLVLVVGGAHPTKPFAYSASAEIFDPSDATWTPTGALAVARGASTASLLADGRVLVAGGVDDGDNTVGAVELYDPEAGTWAFTGAMLEPRLVHTATSLPDGRVLMAGGMTDDFFETMAVSAETFDPATGSFSSAGAIDPRWLHSATLTEDGKVLVAGGYISVRGNGGWYLSSEVGSAAIFEPSKDAWYPAEDLRVARHGHLAVRLRGHGVLVFGGRRMTSQSPMYMTVAVDDVELLSGAAWRGITSTGGLPATSADYHSATELADGSVLFLGARPGARALLLRH
jgi:hypothetical protein